MMITYLSWKVLVSNNSWYIGSRISLNITRPQKRSSPPQKSLLWRETSPCLWKPRSRFEGVVRKQQLFVVQGQRTEFLERVFAVVVFPTHGWYVTTCRMLVGKIHNYPQYLSLSVSEHILMTHSPDVLTLENVSWLWTSLGKTFQLKPTSTS